ncbi:MAG: ribosome biogenesis GTP-binding protein YihA/YsxC [Xanthomonadales bacterium]|nr:ribosome biogenesis GTP-binding protein YihA/YsxC [Xanthomonadales bacterium]
MVNRRPTASRLLGARFMKSAPSMATLPTDAGSEVAFVGRSNAGKSTALNAICQQRALARTSRTPGRTRELNYFAVAETERLVDLPGYGYAAVPVAMQQAWGEFIALYFAERRSLQGMVQLVDSRHGIRELDAELLCYAWQRHLPALVLLSKADKLNRQEQVNAVRQANVALATLHPEARVLLFSAKERLGIEDTRRFIEQRLAPEAPAEAGPTGADP